MSKGRDPNSLEEKLKQIREGVGYDSDNENEPDYEATGGGANEQKEEKKESPAKASLSDVFQKISIPKHITTQTSQKTKDNDWDDIEEIQLPPETPSKETGTKKIGKVKIPSASDKVEGQLSLQDMLERKVKKSDPVNINQPQQPPATQEDQIVVSSDAPPPPPPLDMANDKSTTIVQAKPPTIVRHAFTENDVVSRPIDAQKQKFDNAPLNSNDSMSAEQEPEIILKDSTQKYQSYEETKFDTQMQQYEETEKNKHQLETSHVKKEENYKINEASLNVLKEIHSTEKTFIKNMQEFVAIIEYTGIRNNLSRDNKIKFDSILKSYKELAKLAPLPGGGDTEQPTVASLISGITDLAQENFENRKQLLREITINYEDDINFLNELQHLKKVKNNPKAVEFFNGVLKQSDVFPEKINRSATVSPLENYLIQPVQRPGRYALLLKELAARLSPDDPELPKVISARDEIGRYMTETNNKMNENVFKNFQSEILKKFTAKRDRLKPEDKKIDLFNNLILNILTSTNLEEIRDNLELASSNQTLTSSRGVRESTTSKLITQYLDKVKERLPKQTDPKPQAKLATQKSVLEAQPIPPSSLRSEENEINIKTTSSSTFLSKPPPFLSQITKGVSFELYQSVDATHNRDALNKLLEKKDKIFVYKEYNQNLNMVYSFGLTEALREVFQDKEQFDEFMTALKFKDETKREEIRNITNLFLTEKISKAAPFIPKKPHEGMLFKNYNEKSETVILDATKLIELANLATEANLNDKADWIKQYDIAYENLERMSDEMDSLARLVVEEFDNYSPRSPDEYRNIRNEKNNFLERNKKDSAAINDNLEEAHELIESVKKLLVANVDSSQPQESISVVNKKATPPPVPTDLADELEKKYPGIIFPSGRKYADSVVKSSTEFVPPPLLSDIKKGFVSFEPIPSKTHANNQALEKILRIKNESLIYKNPTLKDKFIPILTFNLTNELRIILNDAELFNKLMDELKITGDDQQKFRDLAEQEMEMKPAQRVSKVPKKIPDEIQTLLKLSEEKITLATKMLNTAKIAENHDEDNTALDKLIVQINNLASQVGFVDDEKEEEIDDIPHAYENEKTIFERNELKSNKILKGIEKIWNRAKPVPLVQNINVDKSPLNKAALHEELEQELNKLTKGNGPVITSLFKKQNVQDEFILNGQLNKKKLEEFFNVLDSKSTPDDYIAHLGKYRISVDPGTLQSLANERPLYKYEKILPIKSPKQNATDSAFFKKQISHTEETSASKNQNTNDKKPFSSFAPDNNGYGYRNKPPLPTMLQPNLSFEVSSNIMTDLSDDKSNDLISNVKRHSQLSDLLQTMKPDERLEFFKKIPPNKLEEIIGNDVTLSLFLKNQYEAKNYKIIQMIQPTFILKSLQTRVEGLRFLLESIPGIERQNIFNSIELGFINAYITDPERMTSFINVLFKYDLRNNFVADKDKIRSIINNETDLEIAFTQASIETQKILINALDNKIVDILSTAVNADTIANIFIHLPKDYRQRVTKKMGENWLQEITLNITDDKLAAKFQAFIPSLTKSTTLPDDPYNFSSFKKLQNYHKGLSMLRTSQENISQPKFQLTEEESRRARINSSDLGPSQPDRITLVLSEKVNKKQMSFDFEAILNGLSEKERKGAVRMIASIIRQDHEINNLSFNLTQMNDAEIKLIAESLKYRDDNNFLIYNLHLFNGDGIQLRDVTKWVDTLSILPDRVDRIGIQFSISEVEKDLMRNDAYRFNEGNAHYEKILAYSRLSRADEESQQFMKHYKNLLSEKDLRRPRPLEIPNNPSMNLRESELLSSPSSSVSSSSELLSPISPSLSESLTPSPVSRESLNYATTDSESSDSELSPVHEPMSPLSPNSDGNALVSGESIETPEEFLKRFVEDVKKQQSKSAFNVPNTPLNIAIKEIDTTLRLSETNVELDPRVIQKLILDVANILPSLQKRGRQFLSNGNLTDIAKKYEKEIQKFLTPQVSPKQIT